MLDGGCHRRLLLIESHAGLRRDLVRALSHVGFIVEDFANAHGLTGKAGAKPSLVQVIDLGAGGAEAWLQSAGSVESTIVLVSDPALLVDRKASVPDGMEVVFKPFSIHTLETRVLARSAPSYLKASGTTDLILETREPEVSTLLARARRLARRDLPIVIEGELGTGRRALAEAIHGWSPRAGSRLLSIERSELEAAGPSGLNDAIDEVMEAAAGGSVAIIDPIDFPEPLQFALVAGMRRFDEKGPRWLTITKQSLDEAVRDGRLTLELQYRLDAARLAMPAIRDRKQDQMALCEGIARRVAQAMGEPVPEIDQTMVELLARDGFPGNRLGIESRLRSGMVRSDGQAGSLARILSEEVNPSEGRQKTSSSLHLKTLERDTIIRALAHWDGNRTRASESLGINVRTLRNKIREYGLR